MKKTDVYIWCLGALICANTSQSCSSEEIISEQNSTATINSEFDPENLITEKYTGSQLKPAVFNEISFDGVPFDSPCETTDFGRVLSDYFLDLINDPYFDFELVQYYADLNRRYVTFYVGENYYGPSGEYNMLARKRIRQLTAFWKLDREIYLNGQHSEHLNDIEILTDMIESFDRTVRNRTEAYNKASSLLEINAKSSNLPENPYFSLDAFTRSNGLLVIGDGLLKILTDVGIDGNIAFSSILAHEWWHQAQFENEWKWRIKDRFPNRSEFSRFSELESDFAAAYFLTHKRGATYNWKRIENYFKLSFNVGDCLVESDQHHGTPSQRMAAARSGFELAHIARKKGFILSAEEIHQTFIEFYDSSILKADLRI
ncbi:MAG: hypothetical protein KJP01_01075 [Gramella sp.]|nr:hypothetical protein [Christiangramia sp.]